jgi:putative copper export protein
MLGLWSIVRFAHVLSAMVWVGGQLTLSAMLLPIVRARLTGADRADVMRRIGQRFGIFTVTLFLPIQVGTGVLLAWRRGVTFSSLTHPGYGRTLLAKLIVFALVMAVSGVHGWAQGTRRAGWARSLAIGSVIGSLVIVLLATALPST